MAGQKRQKQPPVGGRFPHLVGCGYDRLNKHKVVDGVATAGMIRIVQVLSRCLFFIPFWISI